MYKLYKSKGIFYRLIVGTAYRYSIASGQLDAELEIVSKSSFPVEKWQV